MIIAPLSYNDTATIADQSTAEVTLPASNVLADQPRDLWRTTTNLDSYIEIDLGSSKTFNTIAVLYSNCDSSVQVRFRADDDQADLTGTPTLDSGLRTFQHRSDLSSYFGRYHHIYQPGANTLRYVRVDFSSMSAMSYLDVGNIVISNGFIGLVPRHGHTVRISDFATRMDTRGALFGIPGKKRRVLGFEFAAESPANIWDEVQKVELNLDGDRPALYSIDPGNTDYEMMWTVLGYSMPGIYTRTLSNISERTAYEIHEMELP